MLLRRLTFRLYPSKAQKQKLFEARRLHAYLYNACLSHRKMQWQRFGTSVSYIEQQNALPEFKEDWEEFKQLNSMALQATVKRVDLAYNAFFKGLRKHPKFKSIRTYSGWTYSDARQGFKPIVKSSKQYEARHGWLNLTDLGIQIRMRGQHRQWGKPTSCTIVYKPGLNQWFASITIELPEPEAKFHSQTNLNYEKTAAMDLGTETALTLFDGEAFQEIDNERFERQYTGKIKQSEKQKRRKRAPKKKVCKASRRWKQAQRKTSKLKRKLSNSRKDWQHKVTTDISRRYDIVVTEQLNTKNMTRKGKKRKRQKAGLNKAILDVGFGTINKMVQYKITGKGGAMFYLATRIVKPSQRCPFCGVVHPEWAHLSQRVHHCEDCGSTIPRDRGSVVVMLQTLLGNQPGLGTNASSDGGWLSTTSDPSKRKHTGGMKQLGQKKRQKSLAKAEGLQTSSADAVG
jgi:putative transposase